MPLQGHSLAAIMTSGMHLPQFSKYILMYYLKLEVTKGLDPPQVSKPMNVIYTHIYNNL